MDAFGIIVFLGLGFLSYPVADVCGAYDGKTGSNKGLVVLVAYFILATCAAFRIIFSG